MIIYNWKVPIKIPENNYNLYFNVSEFLFFIISLLHSVRKKWTKVKKELRLSLMWGKEWWKDLKSMGNVCGICSENHPAQDSN